MFQIFSQYSRYSKVIRNKFLQKSPLFFSTRFYHMTCFCSNRHIEWSRSIETIYDMQVTTLNDIISENTGAAVTQINDIIDSISFSWYLQMHINDIFCNLNSEGLSNVEKSKRCRVVNINYKRFRVVNINHKKPIHVFIARF